MSGGVPCPECGCKNSRVTDSRPSGDTVRRRRYCPKCALKWSTYEVSEFERRTMRDTAETITRLRHVLAQEEAS